MNQDSLIWTMPPEIMAEIMSYLPKRDVYALSNVNRRMRGMIGDFERKRMGQELFVDQRHENYLRRVAAVSVLPLVEREAQRVQTNHEAARQKVVNVLEGVRQVAIDMGEIPRAQQASKVRSLVMGLGFDDVLSTYADFMAPNYNIGIPRIGVERLESHYRHVWTPGFIAELMRRNPVYWHMLDAWNDPEDMEKLIETLKTARGGDQSVQGPKRARDLGWDWADRVKEYNFAKDHIKRMGPERPFVYSRMYPFMDPRFRERFSYDIPGLITPHPSYTQVAPGSGTTPPTFELLEGHSSPW